MLSSLALTLGMIAALAGGEQPPAPIKMAPQKAAEAVKQEQVPAGKYYSNAAEVASSENYWNGGCSSCGGHGCSSCGGGCGNGGCAPWESAACGGYSVASGDCDPRGRGDHCGQFISCCNMSLHHAYYPQANGYYYFRPYNYTHICQQQHVIVAWGGDKRHPYDTRFVFDKVYADLESEGLIAPDKPADDMDAVIVDPVKPMPKMKEAQPKKAAPDDLKPGASLPKAGRSVVKVEYVQE